MIHTEKPTRKFSGRERDGPEDVERDPVALHSARTLLFPGSEHYVSLIRWWWGGWRTPQASRPPCWQVSRSAFSSALVASLGTLVLALPRAPSTPAGRSHTRSNGGGYGGHEAGTLLGAPWVALHLQKDPYVFGVPAPGLWGQRRRTPRRAPCQNHWQYPLGASGVRGVLRERCPGRSAHSPEQL
jgi:hypothetical protein